MSGATERQRGMQPSRAEITAQLEAMLADKSFAGADRLSRMLRYLVETAVRGGGSDLKEYTVGVEVFDRDAAYDPRTDSVVRVHGTRLRSKLAEYYASTGVNERVIIELPKGGYIPAFRYRAEVSAGPRMITLEPRSSALLAPGVVSRRRTFAWIATAAVAIVLITAGVAVVRHFLAKPPAPGRSVVRPITSMTGNQRFPSFSPDGSEIVFSWEGENAAAPGLYITTRDGGPVRRLTSDPEPERAPAWSPDGRSIAFIRGEHSVMLVSPVGGSARKMADTDGKFVSWTPDAESVLISKRQPSGNVLYAVSVATGQQRALTSPAEDPDNFEPFAISPDGKFLGYARRSGDRANASIYVRRLSGGAPVRLTQGLGEIMGWSWTTDTDEIVLSMAADVGYRLWRARPESGEPIAIPDTEGAQFPTVGREPVSTGRLGELIAYERSYSHAGLNEIDLGPGERSSSVRPLLASTGADTSPQFSPDGKWIVFTSNRGGFNEIWRSDSAGRNPTVLTSLGREQKSPGSPRWSPDSSRIVFDARDASHSNIYEVGVDGGPVRKVTRWPADQVRPRWSRDGKWIYFATTYPSRWSMWKAPAEATEITPERAQRLTSEKGFEPVESPDGSAIYFFRATLTNSVGQLFSVPVGGGPATKVMDDLVNHGWWALGRNGIYFVGMTPGKPPVPAPTKERPIEYLSFATHRVTHLGSIAGPIWVGDPSFCVSPDERRMVYGQLDASTNIMLIEPVH